MITFKIPKIKEIKLQELVILLFIFLGPLGTLLTPSFFPTSTRTYYFVLFLFPVFFLRFNKKIINLIISLLPLLSYALFSALYTQTTEVLRKDAFPLFRCFLLFIHIFFLLGINNYLSKKVPSNFLPKIIKIYIFSYSLSLIWGFVLYFGFLFNKINFALLNRFNILTQYGWGVLRFNPGSYANEYGVFSSFIICLLILVILYSSSLFKKRRKIKIILLLMLMVFSLLALILASTRASLISISLSLIFLVWCNKKFRKNFILYFCFIFIAIAIFQHFKIGSSSFLQKGLLTLSKSTARASGYSENYFSFIKHPLLGSGFASLSAFHNVYLEILYELGFLGILLLLIPFSYLFINKKKFHVFHLKKRSFLDQITVIGFIHVLSFAATNHNLLHHLTWFVFLLYTFRQNQKESKVLKDEILCKN